MMSNRYLTPLPIIHRRLWSALLMTVGLVTSVLIAGPALAADGEGTTSAVAAAVYVQFPADQVSSSRGANPRQTHFPAREVRLQRDIEAGLGTDGLETLVAGLEVTNSTDGTAGGMDAQRRSIEVSMYAAIGGVLALMLTVLAGVNSRKRWPVMTSRRIRIRSAEQH